MRYRSKPPLNLGFPTEIHWCICISMPNYQLSFKGAITRLFYMIKINSVLKIKTGNMFLVAVSAQRRGRSSVHFAEAVSEGKFRASTRCRALKLQTRFGWVVLTQIITRRVRILAETYGIVAEISERQTAYLNSRWHLSFAVPARGNTPSEGIA